MLIIDNLFLSVHKTILSVVKDEISLSVEKRGNLLSVAKRGYLLSVEKRQRKTDS